MPLVLAAAPLVYDAYVFVGVLGGRDAFLARAGEPSMAFGVVGFVLVLVGLFAHGLLATRLRSVPVETTRGHLSPGNRRLQQASAVFALVFLAAHQRHSIFVAGIEGLGAGGLFERIRNDCDGYVWFSVYVLGLAALALHLAQGAYAACTRARFAAAPVRRLLGGSLVVVVVLSFTLLTDALAAYTAGAPLFSSP